MSRSASQSRPRIRAAGRELAKGELTAGAEPAGGELNAGAAGAGTLADRRAEGAVVWGGCAFSPSAAVRFPLDRVEEPGGVTSCDEPEELMAGVEPAGD